MNVQKIFREQRAVIVEGWINAVYSTYPLQTTGFLRTKNDPFTNPVGDMTKEAAGLIGRSAPADMDSRFRMIYHVGTGYAIPNAEDTPYIEELARQEGILLDPVYTGKAWAKFLMLVKEGYFDGQEHIAFVHTGGAAALFAMDLG